MKYVVQARPTKRGWRATIIVPGEQPESPFETELYPVFTESRKLERCLLKGVKTALRRDDCTEIQVIVR